MYMGGLAISVISTSKGVMTGKEAFKNNLGGRNNLLHLVDGVNMSRIGKLPIKIPSEVNVSINGKEISFKGPKGEEKVIVHDSINIKT